MMTAEEIIALLNLRPHPTEGGFFSETYRAGESIPPGALPSRYVGPFHFYLGDPVEMLQLLPDGTGKTVVLGTDLRTGMQPQVVVPRGVWQGSCLIGGGKFALLGCTVAPGFEFADYEHGSRNGLIRSYPQFREQIAALTAE